MRSYILVVLLVLPVALLGDYLFIPLKKEKDKIDESGFATVFRSRYSGDIDVGTPPQRLKAIFNTGSESLWVPIVRCKAAGADTIECKEGRNVFFPKISKTFENTEQLFQTGYGGSLARGTVFKDRLTIRGKNGKDLVFSNNVFMGGANYLEGNDDTVIGLPSFPNGLPYDRSYSTILYDEINNKGVNSTYFTLYTAGCRNEACGNRATLTIGGYDHIHCKHGINYTDISHESQNWEFPTQGFGVGGQFHPNDYTARVDSGSGYIRVPNNVFSMYATKWNAKPLGNKGAYGVKCSTKLDVVVRINNIDYPIPSENLLHPLPEKGQKKFGSSMCQIAMKWSEDIDVTLGEPFLRSYCVVHDIANRQIGFSRKHTEDLRNED